MDINTGIILNKPASIHRILEIEKELNCILPDTLKNIWGYTDGLTNDDGIGIYGTDEIVERNETFEVSEYAKGYVAIGDDGGDNVFLMKCNKDSKEVISVDCGYMNPNDGAGLITNDINKWIEDGCKVELINSCNIDLCYILLIGMPKNGVKDLLVIKKIFTIDTSIGELIRGAKKLPYVIISNYPYEKARILLERLGKIRECLKVVSK